MKRILLFGDDSSLLVNARTRRAQKCEKIEISCEFSVSRVFVDTKEAEFFLEELPYIPFWRRERLVRAHLTPTVPSLWLYIKLSEPRSFRKETLRFQVVQLPLLEECQAAEVQENFLREGEPLLLALPEYYAYLTGEKIFSRTWWGYLAFHTLSGLRLVVGKGKGIVLSRTFSISEKESWESLDFLHEELRLTKEYLHRLGWKEAAFRTLTIGSPEMAKSWKVFYSYEEQAHVKWIFSPAEIAKRLAYPGAQVPSAEELLLHWILRQKQHFPSFASFTNKDPQQPRHQLVRAFCKMRPILQALSLALVCFTLTTFWELYMLRHESQRTQQAMEHVFSEVAEARSACLGRLSSPTLPYDLDKALKNLVQLERCVQKASEAKASAVYPKLERLAPIFQSAALKSITLRNAPKELVTLEIDISPQEKIVFANNLHRRCPEYEEISQQVLPITHTPNNAENPRKRFQLALRPKKKR